MTRADRVAKLTSIEQTLTVGKRLCVKFSGARLALTHPKPELWHVNASYPTMRERDTYGDDWESRICDCDLARTPHAHFRADFTSYREAMEAFADAEQAMQARQPVTLPEAWMPAWV